MSHVHYVQNNDADLALPRGTLLQLVQLEEAAHATRRTMEQFASFDVDVFKLLGMRNLSAFVGEVFSASLKKSAGELFLKNPHQDGYPDLLLMDDVGRRHYHTLQKKLQDKAPFSPFRTGGVEVKATCGSVPTPAACAKLGRRKPEIGEERADLLKGYDWKAHHRETNYLMGVFWDFVAGVPAIVGLFYGNSLCTDDWGKIVTPKKGGGRTTSVSIMTRAGVKKMYSNWALVLNDERYIEFFNAYNKHDLMEAAF